MKGNLLRVGVFHGCSKDCVCCDQQVNGCKRMKMPYEVVLPIIVRPVAKGDVPYDVLYPDMPTSLEDLQREWIQLKGERDTFEAQFYAREQKTLDSRDNFMRRGA